MKFPSGIKFCCWKEEYFGIKENNQAESTRPGPKEMETTISVKGNL